MQIADINGIRLAYEVHGDPAAPPVLMIMGLGGQLTMWPSKMVTDLVAAGYRPIIFDNRDVGLSTKFDDTHTPHLLFQHMSRQFGVRLNVPYTLEDMAGDALGLLDHLELEQAHLLGVSMGGMIAQILAANAADRVLSLSAMMTGTGNPRLTRPRPEVLWAMLKGKPKAENFVDLVDRAVETFGLIGTPGEDHHTNGMRERIATSYARDYSPAGSKRQTAAIVATGDFRHQTRRIKAPTLVIHGSEDPLVPPGAGRDVAALVPGARFHLVEGMGHDLPPRYLAEIMNVLREHLASVEQTDRPAASDASPEPASSEPGRAAHHPSSL